MVKMGGVPSGDSDDSRGILSPQGGSDSDPIQASSLGRNILWVACTLLGYIYTLLYCKATTYSIEDCFDILCTRTALLAYTAFGQCNACAWPGFAREPKALRDFVT